MPHTRAELILTDQSKKVIPRHSRIWPITCKESDVRSIFGEHMFFEKIRLRANKLKRKARSGLNNKCLHLTLCLKFYFIDLLGIRASKYWLHSMDNNTMSCWNNIEHSRTCKTFNTEIWFIRFLGIVVGWRRSCLLHVAYIIHVCDACILWKYQSPKSL